MAKAIPKQKTKKEVTLNKSGLEKIVTFLKSQFPGIENILIIVDEGLKIEGTDIKLSASTLITEVGMSPTIIGPKYASPAMPPRPGISPKPATPPKPAMPPKPAPPPVTTAAAAATARPSTPAMPAPTTPTTPASPSAPEMLGGSPSIDEPENVPINVTQVGNEIDPATHRAPYQRALAVGKGPRSMVRRTTHIGRAEVERAKHKKAEDMRSEIGNIAQDEVQQAFQNIAQTLQK